MLSFGTSWIHTGVSEKQKKERRCRMKMDKEQLEMIFTFVKTLVAEVCVFIFAVVVVLCMAGVL